jgi:hypothetical protein
MTRHFVRFALVVTLLSATAPWALRTAGEILLLPVALLA